MEKLAAVILVGFGMGCNIFYYFFLVKFVRAKTKADGPIRVFSALTIVLLYSLILLTLLPTITVLALVDSVLYTILMGAVILVTAIASPRILGL